MKLVARRKAGRGLGMSYSWPDPVAKPDVRSRYEGPQSLGLGLGQVRVHRFEAATGYSMREVHELFAAFKWQSREVHNKKNVIAEVKVHV